MNSTRLPFVDAHNHLQEEVLEPYVEAVMERARAVGVRRMLVNGTHEGDWPRVRELAAQYPEVVPCYGLHPWFVQERSDDWLQKLEEYLSDPRSLLGEIGLDRWVKTRDETAQEAVFRTQLALAARLERPATVHCLQAWGWLLDILREIGPLPRPLLFHAFGGSIETMDELDAAGAYFSFGGAVLGEGHARAKQALQGAPLDRLLVETDAPALLPPEPWRLYAITDGEGTWNEPGNLPAIASGLAEFRGIGTEELVAATWQNCLSFLGE